MKKHIINLLLVSAVSGFSSCSKYVEVEQPNQRVLKYTSDYQALLSNVSYFERGYAMPLLSESDVDAGGITTIEARLTNEIANVYTWAADYYTADQTDATWNQLYNLIYECNEIIAHVMGSVNGTEEQKKVALAEAQTQRAYNYLMLMNIYAPVYKTATATTDLGVPMQLSPDLFTNLTRPSVQQVYDQIIADVNAALPNLPRTAANNLHAAKAAAYATLARTYLYMQQYDKAAENAGLALSIQDSLLDLSVYTTTLTNFPRRLYNPEVILSKKASRPGNFTMPLSAKLLNLFTTTDLRYTLFTRAGTSFAPSFTGRGSYKHQMFSGDDVNIGVSVPEMMLIQAEGMARNNQVTEAMAMVNKLRRKRFKTADYVALTATTSAQAVKQVLDERRRELFGTGLRWFDQRRLGTETAYAETETRVFKTVNYTLTPGSNRFVYPIAPFYITLNPEIKQNGR